MLYFSQILNSKIEDSADVIVGRLKDILIKPEHGQYAALAFLLVKSARVEYFIPYEMVENLSGKEITLKCRREKIPAADINEEAGYIYLNRDVLDQQIVDVGGARVVRVNDLKLGAVEDKMSVLGIDVSTKGLLRRLNFDWFDVFDAFKVHLIDWRKVQPIKGTIHLNTMAKNLNRLHPADLANVIEDLNVKQGGKIVVSLDANEAAKVVEELDPHLQKMLVNHLGPERAAKIIEKMSVDEIADLIQLFPKAEAQALLAQLKNGKMKKVEKLISYEEDTAGGLMTMDFVMARPDWTVEKTIAEIRSASQNLRSVLFVYVVNNDGNFIGPVSLRSLLLSDRDVYINKLAKPNEYLTTLHPDDSLDIVVNKMTKYNLYTAAVVDAERKMLGMVSIDDVMRCLAPKA